MQMVTGKCPECQQEIVPGKDQAQFNRNLGLHRRAKHGYRSPAFYEHRKYERKKKLERLSRSSPEFKARNLRQLDEARRKRWREYKQQLRRNGVSPKSHRKQVPPPQLQNQTSEAVPCNLASCPVCGSRFFVVKGQ